MEHFTSSTDLLSLGLLILRIGLGVIFFAHGAQKVFGWFGGYGLAGTSGFLKQAYGIPTFLSYIAAFTELLGSIAVTFGIFTRIGAIGLGIVMLVAVVKAHLKVGFFMNWGSVANRGEGYEFNIALLAIIIALALIGPGQYALLG